MQSDATIQRELTGRAFSCIPKCLQGKFLFGHGPNGMWDRSSLTRDKRVPPVPPAKQEIHRRCRFNPWVGKIPWRREWKPTPVFLPGEFHGQRSLLGYSPLGCKELGMTE